jgi:predicted transcriptional regulator
MCFVNAFKLRKRGQSGLFVSNLFLNWFNMLFCIMARYNQSLMDHHKRIHEITPSYLLLLANQTLQMSRINRIICTLSKGGLTMVELQRICSGTSKTDFYKLLDDLAEYGDIEKRVNGITLYQLTEQGLKRYKQLKKQARILFK